MERTPWKLPSLTHAMDVTYWNVRYGSYLVELTSWKLPLGT